jgi:hypothetical protein
VRIELSFGPEGTKFVVLLSETESRNLNSGLELESHAWKDTLRQRIESEGSLDSIRRYQAALASSRAELAELVEAEQQLRAQRQKALASGTAVEATEKKLTATLTTAGVVRGRIQELERLLASQISLAASDVSQFTEDVMAELYSEQQRQQAEMEAQFLEIAGPLILDMIRRKKLWTQRGFSLQAFRRRLGEGRGAELVQRYLREPAAEADPAMATMETA